jgi:hypothetical protein
MSKVNLQTSDPKIELKHTQDSKSVAGVSVQLKDPYLKAHDDWLSIHRDIKIMSRDFKLTREEMETIIRGNASSKECNVCTG